MSGVGHRTGRAGSVGARLGGVLVGWLVAGALAGCAPQENPPPNIVLIVGDDLGWPDYGFMGSEVARTPHLDALAARGTVFTHAFNTASTCRPSLGTLLTGLYPLQFHARLEERRRDGVDVVHDHEIAHFETLPDLLSRRGYVSFQGGKLWGGSYAEAGFSHGMTDPERWTAEATGFARASGAQGLALGRETMRPLFEFIDAQAERPFFVWFAPRLPHVPHDPPQRLLSLYENVSTPIARRYYANVSRLDERVGELLAHLEARKLRERTLVVYLADNGWDPEPPIALDALGGPGGKLSMHELGFRTPIVLSWPGTVPEGRRAGQLVSSVDLVATLLDVAGAAAPPDARGSSFYGLLRGEEGFARERVIGSMAKLRNPGFMRGMSLRRLSRPAQAYFARTPGWRYVWYRDLAREELYRIDDDPRETLDVAGRHPEVTRRLRGEIERWAADLGAALDPMPAPPRHLVLLSVDTLRADRLGAYGGRAGLTPNLDALTRESVHFRNAYAPAPFTLPSIAALLTGRHPLETGIDANIGFLPRGMQTLAARLRDAGFATGAVVSSFVLRALTGLDRGFDHYDARFPQREQRRGSPERTATATTDAAVSLLDELLDQGDRVFLWVHYQDPHGPYTPPAGWRERVGAGPAHAPREPRSLRFGGDGRGAIPTYQYLPPHRDPAYYRAGYDAEVAYTDAEIGRLFDALRERDVSDRSVVVFTADHGESLGEQDYWFAHGALLNEASLRVPLLLRVPGRPGAARGDAASLVDVLPTLARLLGFDPGAASGRDLLAPGAESFAGSVFFATWRHRDEETHTGLVRGPYKLVRSSGRSRRQEDRLFRLPDDRPAREPAVLRTLREDLDRQLPRFQAPPAAQPPSLTPSEREALEALGYLGD